VSEEGKIEVLSRAWVFVTPSMKEGWGITVIEANDCGTPAIGYDVPGLRDSIQDGKTGLLVPQGNIDRLTAAIVNVLTDEDLRNELSRNALDWASGFTWDNSAGAFSEVLIEALQC
jgi:glycosyltransferase involved in cell wall biosynthesis